MTITSSAKLFCGFISLTAVTFASAPVASVSSTSPFTLDGSSLTVAGVMSWPLVIGDELATNTASASILFKDGSNVTLAPKSTLKITGQEGSPVVVLESGSVDYKLVKDSKVSLIRLQDAQIPNFQAVATGKLSNNHTYIVAPAVVAAAGGASALGLALASHGAVSSGSSTTVGALSSGSTPGSVATTTSSTDSDFTARALSLSKYK
jgi:hypothetical protein